MAVVATLSKGYDLDYIWKQVDRGPVKDAASYYIQACESGGEPPGRWWGPGAETLGFESDQSRDRWTGTITVGWKPDGRRDRIIVRGRTKTEVKDKPRVKHQELAAGIRTPAKYTVEQCRKDWLETLSTHADSTATGYRIMVRYLV